MRKWVIEAVAHSGKSQAALSRDLHLHFGWTENRSLLNKIVIGTREVSGKELLDISRVTGYPLPETYSSWQQKILDTISQAKKSGIDDETLYEALKSIMPEQYRLKIEALEMTAEALEKVRILSKNYLEKQGLPSKGDRNQ